MLKKWMKRKKSSRYNNYRSRYTARYGARVAGRSGLGSVCISFFKNIIGICKTRDTRFGTFQGLFLKIITGACLVCIILFFVRNPVMRLLENMAFFRVEKPIIRENIVVSDEEIKLLAGISTTSSIFSIAENELAGRITAHPWIEKAVVKKHFPNEVIIEVQEHHPIALVVTEEDKLAYMDIHGSIFTHAIPGDMLDYPVITGMQGLLEEEKKEVTPDIVAFLKYLNRENPNFYAQMVSEIHFQGGEQWLIVHLVDFDFPISLGKGKMKDKYAFLKEIFTRSYKPHGNEVRLEDIRAIRMDYSNEKVYIKKELNQGNRNG